MGKFKKRNYTAEEYRNISSVYLFIAGFAFVGYILAFFLEGGLDPNKSLLEIFFSFSPLIMSLILGILYRKKGKINKSHNRKKI